MTEYILSPAAESDINNIWDYTVKNWGVAQAASYVGDIRDVCVDLSTGERFSRPVTVRDGYQKALTGLHVIYFRWTDQSQIVVVRILHQSMDVERHLSK